MAEPAMSELTPEEEAAALQQLKDELRKRDELISKLTEEKDQAIAKLQSQIEAESGGRYGARGGLTPRPPGAGRTIASPRRAGADPSYNRPFKLTDLEASKPRSPRTKLPVLPTSKAQYTPNPRTPAGALTSRGPPRSPHNVGSMSARGAAGGEEMTEEEREARMEELRAMEQQLDYLRIEEGDDEDAGPRDVTAWKEDENLDKWWKEVMQRKSETRAKQMKKVKKDMKWIEKMKQKQKQRQKAKEKEEKHMAAEEAKRRNMGWRGRMGGGLASSTGQEGKQAMMDGMAEPPRATLQPATNDEPLKWQIISAPPKKKKDPIGGKKEMRVWCRPGLFKTFVVD